MVVFRWTQEVQREGYDVSTPPPENEPPNTPPPNDPPKNDPPPTPPPAPNNTGSVDEKIDKLFEGLTNLTGAVADIANKLGGAPQKDVSPERRPWTKIGERRS